jgi:hypothetical protein
MSPHIKLAIIAFVVSACAATYADIPLVEISCWTGDGVGGEWYPQGVDNGDGTYSYSGWWEAPDGGGWVLSLESLLVKPDPFINVVYGLTNNLDTTQNFTLIVTLPISPQITPSSLIGGSTQGGITDANYDGTGTLATIAPDPFYAGTIDGATALPLLADPYSVSVPYAGGSANIPATSAGLPGPTLPGPAVLTDIGITHRFSLTAHDTVGITSFFIAVPEPAGLLLLALVAPFLRRR